MYGIPDHPVIRNMESTGYPDGRRPVEPVCPKCDKKAETFYKNEDGDIVGCDRCIRTIEAWEAWEDLSYGEF